MVCRTVVWLSNFHHCLWIFFRTSLASCHRDNYGRCRWRMLVGRLMDLHCSFLSMSRCFFTCWSCPSRQSNLVKLMHFSNLSSVLLDYTHPFFILGLLGGIGCCHPHGQRGIYSLICGFLFIFGGLVSNSGMHLHVSPPCYLRNQQHLWSKNWQKPWKC